MATYLTLQKHLRTDRRLCLRQIKSVIVPFINRGAPSAFSLRNQLPAEGAPRDFSLQKHEVYDGEKLLLPTHILFDIIGEWAVIFHQDAYLALNSHMNREPTVGIIHDTPIHTREIICFRLHNNFAIASYSYDPGSSVDATRRLSLIDYINPHFISWIESITAFLRRLSPSSITGKDVDIK